MFIIRHPRHRTGVHTDAVTISSTPGPPIIILDQPLHTKARKMRVDKEHEYFTPNSTDELIANSLRCAVKIVTSE